jgi:hypothetical protein
VVVASLERRSASLASQVDNLGRCWKWITLPKYYGRQKKWRFFKKKSFGIKCYNFFSVRDRAKIQTDLRRSSQRLLKNAWSCYL